MRRPSLLLGSLGAVLALNATAHVGARTDVRVVPNDNRVPAGVREGDTLALRLVVASGAWRLLDDDSALTVLAFAEEGKAPTVPGPLLRVRAGTPVRVTVRNPLADSLVVHGFGARGDGAPDSLVVPPGAEATTRFAAGRPGTYLYWASDARRPIARRTGADGQLSGAFVVDPAGGARRPADRVLVITEYADTARRDGSLIIGRYGVPVRDYVALNGRAWPYTERLAAAVGDSVRWRVLNASFGPHTMHLHGFYFGVDAKGDDAADADTSYAPAERRMAVTELLASGQTMAMAWSPDRPGGWIFHCHMTMHAVRGPPIGRRDQLEYPTAHAHGDPEQHARAGMGGLVLAMAVTGRSTAPSATGAPARRLRLFVQSDSSPGDTVRRFGYVLQRGSRAPAPDSIVRPGPVLELTRGEPTSIEVVNRTAEPTAVHWHGMELDSYYDGVVGVGGVPGGRPTPAIRPGATFTVRLTPRRAGTFMYHTHFDELRQQSGGLAGALLVLAPGERRDPARDRVFTITDGVLRRVLLNASLTPPAETLHVGTTYRLRFANAALFRPTARVRIVRDTAHAARLGVPQPSVGDLLRWRPLAKDAWPIVGARAAVRPSVAVVGSGETADFAFTPDRPGPLTLDVLGTFLVGVDGPQMLVMGAVRLQVVDPPPALPSPAVRAP